MDDDYSHRIRVMRGIALSWQRLYKQQKEEKELLLKVISKFNETRSHTALSSMLEVWRDMENE